MRTNVFDSAHSSNSVFTSDIGKLSGKGNCFFFFIIVGKLYIKLAKIRPFLDWECHL